MFERITSDPGILGGKPIIKGTRISVQFLLELAASGASVADISEAYPELAKADIEEAFRFAAFSMSSVRQFVLAG